MFAFLRGKIVQVETDRVVLDVHGVGYELFASRRTLDQVKAEEEAHLFTHMHVSQDALALYGFLDQQEKIMFLRLIGVSRIGPKVALGMLSMTDVTTLALAIATGDEEMISSLPGIGKKTAQRLILELREKIEKEDKGRWKEELPLNAIVGDFSMKSEAITALMALGYDRVTALQAVEIASSTEFVRVEELITNALKNLAR